MPANLTPEYKAAEEGFRKAREPAERLQWLREMLRTIPKHKGTDHLQADIKSRIKQLTEELAGPKKGGTRSGPETVIHPEGAAQIVLLGPPNSGKSALHARLTGSHAAVGPFPFTTAFPQPGMVPYEDIHFQLIDLPPIVPEHPIAWLSNALQPADACLLVVDLGDPGCLDQVMALVEELRRRSIFLSADWNPRRTAVEDEEILDPFALHLPTLFLVNKADAVAEVEAELAVLRELSGLDYPALVVSALTGAGLEQIAPWLFRALAVVRVYTKAPGRPPDRDRPFTLRRGASVEDVARLVHRELAERLKYARVWGAHRFDGQQVGREQWVEDGDVLELHG
jgi:ribosome-interacting GTPase 1